jgi:hypothetical protein
LLLRSVPPDTVTEENCRRIAKGMTATEVEAIFGRPANHTEISSVPPPPASDKDKDVAEWSELLKRKPFTDKLWLGRAHAALVTFDVDGKLVRVYCYEPEPEPWYKRLTEVLGL